MLERRANKGIDQVVVTFVLPDGDPRLPPSVVGDFNGRNPAVHPPRRRSNGTWSTSAALETGRRVRFRYRSADGTRPNGELADGYVPNDFDSTDCVVGT